MTDSILGSTKKILGLETEYTPFDVDLIMHINSVFSTLNQLGVGPSEGFEITDATATWATFLGGDPRKNWIKTYTYLKVRMLFDPPTTSYLIEAIKEQIRELEWRISSHREMTEWIDPNLTIPSEPVIDGGTP